MLLKQNGELETQYGQHQQQEHARILIFHRKLTVNVKERKKETNLELAGNSRLGIRRLAERRGHPHTDSEAWQQQSHSLPHSQPESLPTFLENPSLSFQTLPCRDQVLFVCKILWEEPGKYEFCQIYFSPQIWTDERGSREIWEGLSKGVGSRSSLKHSGQHSDVNFT